MWKAAINSILNELSDEELKELADVVESRRHPRKAKGYTKAKALFGPGGYQMQPTVKAHFDNIVRERLQEVTR
jgi:hypothetical protein